MHIRKIAACLAALVFVAFCFVLFGPTRGMQVRALKKMVPEVTEYVGNNEEFFNALLNAHQRVIEIVGQISDNSYGTWYSITVDRGTVTDELYGALGNYNRSSFLSDDEWQLVSSTLLQSNAEMDQCSISISADTVDFTYSRSMSTHLIIRSPAIAIKDPIVYTQPFEFTIPVNYDWCIYICNWH
ncbi:MAG: hypothetical protein FWH33_03070 [Oscillospiraceae bacterium]|nr:hypothetical protein [Oscillospiraceae bacterium]